MLRVSRGSSARASPCYDGPATAPSKRLLAYYPGYVKTQDGPAAIELLGVDGLRSGCPHLDRWLAGLLIM